MLTVPSAEQGILNHQGTRNEFLRPRRCHNHRYSYDCNYYKHTTAMTTAAAATKTTTWQCVIVAFTAIIIFTIIVLLHLNNLIIILLVMMIHVLWLSFSLSIFYHYC